MKGRILTEHQIAAFAVHLKNEENSENTVEKYIRDVRAFAAYVGDAEITKETVITYKNNLLSQNYAARSVNSMLASINSLLSFLGWADLKVKSIKLQRQIYCSEEKDIAKLADILGHSSINTTRIYIITTGNEHRRHMENMRLII